MAEQYQWRYFNVKDSFAFGADLNSTIMQMMDAELAALEESKGSLWAHTVELFVETKLFTVLVAPNLAEANTRFTARFVTAVVIDKWGKEESTAKMRELIADADPIAEKIVQELVKAGELANARAAMKQ